jgi:hypothetical protein
VPAPPVNLFPYIFAVYVVIGLVIFAARRKSAKAPSLTLAEGDLELAS